MSKLILTATLALFLAAGSNSAFARPGGGNPGGQSEGHMSTEGMMNTNGPDAADRDKGKDRAEDMHEKHAQGHMDKHHEHGKGHHHGGDEHKDNQ